MKRFTFALSCLILSLLMADAAMAQHGSSRRSYRDNRDSRIRVAAPTGYFPASVFDGAMKAAAKKKKTLAILVSPEYLYARDYQKLRAMSLHRGLRSMGRIFVLGGSMPASMRSSLGKAGLRSVSSLSLSILDGTGKLIAYVPSNLSTKEIDTRINAAAQVVAFRAYAERTLASAKRAVQSGRFDTAMRYVRSIAKKDRRVDQVVTALTGTTPLEMALSKSSPGEKKDKDEQGLEAATISTGGFFFEGLEAQFNEAVEKVATEQFQEIDKLAGEGKLTAAIAKALSMSRNSDGMPLKERADAKVKELRAQLDEQKQAAQAKK